MRFYFLSFLLFVFYLTAHGQTGNQIVIGTIDSLQSEILGEQRRVWVYTPNSGDQDLYASQHYPVVYLLDGPGHFYSVVGMIKQLSTSNGNTLCPAMIIVGIENTNRTRDLTPTAAKDGPLSQDSGGGEPFISFMEKELIPYIQSNYPTQPYRMLIGHSLGGLTTINTLMHHTDLFNAYIAIDPSMWWDDRHLLHETETLLKTKDFTGKSLYLGIANTLPDEMTIKQLKKDTTDDTNHMRAIFELSKALDKNEKNGLTYTYKYYENDDHGSVPLITEYDALRFLFDFYPLELNGDDLNDATMTLANKICDHYILVSNKMGYTIQPPESLINAIGYGAMGNENYQQAEYFFKMNVENYPTSFNVYDSLGDYYVSVDDKSNAIKAYENALSLRENVFSRNKLQALKKK